MPPDSQRRDAVHARRLATLLACACLPGIAHADWPQWGAGPRHENASSTPGQALEFTLADIVYDPFAADEQSAGNGSLTTHFQAPIVDGADVFMTFKTGTWTGVKTWSSQVWNVKRLAWNGDHLGEAWTVASDWKPEPWSIAFWEPVFHPALHGDAVYAPGLGGSLMRLRRSDGFDLGRVTPFGDMPDPGIFVAGPLTIDGDGNIFYNAIKLDTDAPLTSDVEGAWLVRVTPEGASSMVAYAALVPDAPAGSDTCQGTFGPQDLPWPPSTDAVPPDTPYTCGSQRPGINIAPAVADDGTIYTVSRAHRNDRYAYLVAINADLTPKWHASLRDRFDDGCGVLLPSDDSSYGCRVGANVGVDPATNAPGAGRVSDLASSSPTVAPDGSVLYGALTSYNFNEGHLMKFSANGEYQGAYPFGWDLTPAIHRHDGAYSIIQKENHYAAAGNVEEYRITQLDPGLQPEWSFKATNTRSCSRQPDGSLACVSDHPNGFEWCVNAAAVDADGTVFANSEDGGVYAIAQGGTQVGYRFLQLALGAAYTPLAIGSDGRVYTQNFGHLFVVGTAPDAVFADGFETSAGG